MDMSDADTWMAEQEIKMRPMSANEIPVAEMNG
jgi:hypothetical protein